MTLRQLPHHHESTNLVEFPASATDVIDNVRTTARAESAAVIANLAAIAKSERRDAVPAAKLLLGIAGYVAPAATPERAANDKSLADMTADELRSMIEANEAQIKAIERRLSDHAAPVNAPIVRKAADLLD